MLTGALVALASGAAYLWLVRAPSMYLAALPVGTFVLSSQPAGADVLLDGVAAGKTPLVLSLTPGEHAVVVTGANGATQRVTARVDAGESASRHVVLDGSAGTRAEARSAASASAALAPSAAPAASPAGEAAAVTRNREPLTPPATDPTPVPPSEAPAATAPARTASAGAPAPPPSAAPTPARLPGLVTFDVPFVAQVFENGALLGTTDPGGLRVAPGTHTFTLVSPELGFRSEETVVVAAGRPTRHVVAQRTAPLSVNARPWAEVFISGRSFGETPLANIALPIGTYQVTLRHPTLGEREVAVTVRLGAANRLAVDMRQ